MKRTILTVLFFFITFISFSQKMYIWCPDELEPIAQTEKLKGVNVYLNIQDSRLLTKKRKEKCSSDEITSSILNLISSTYPNAIFVSKDQEHDYEINIQLTAYYAEFHTAAWKGKTEMNVELKNITTDETESSEISKSKSNANFGGMITAKNNLRKSYNKAMIELLATINQFLD